MARGWMVNKYILSLASTSGNRALSGIQIKELDISKLTGRLPCNGNALEEMARLREKKWNSFRSIVAHNKFHSSNY